LLSKRQIVDWKSMTEASSCWQWQVNHQLALKGGICQQIVLCHVSDIVRLKQIPILDQLTKDGDDQTVGWKSLR
jgi:hypothetical protein